MTVRTGSPVQENELAQSMKKYLKELTMPIEHTGM